MFNRLPESPIIVCQVFYKVCKQVMKRLAGFRIFLPALGAVSYINCIAAVFTFFIVAKMVAHDWIVWCSGAKSIKKFEIKKPRKERGLK